MDMSTATKQSIIGCQKISACRVCHSDKLSVFWDSGPIHIVEFPKIGEQPIKPKVPMQLAVCESCWLVQLMHTTDDQYLYEEFHYRSGTNEMMRSALMDLAYRGAQEIHLSRGDVVVDIGANDGTLLSYLPKNVIRVACEPAKNLHPMLAERADVLIPNLWSEAAYDRAMSPDIVSTLFAKRHAGISRKLDQTPKAKLVFAIAMFYDLNNPVQFCRDVARVLSEDGVFIVQMNYLPTMLTCHGVDNIVHEHLTYFCLSTLLPVFRMAGLEIYKTEINAVNGGSIRVYACHRGQHMLDGSVADLLGREYKLGLDSPVPYVSFTERAKEVTSVLQALLDGLSHEHAKVYAYGASTRGTTLLQLLNTEGRIAGCAERDTSKLGHYMVGSNVPIVSEDEFHKKAEFGLVLPWHFLPAIREREKPWLEKGNHLITPLPYPKILGVRE